MTAKEHGGGTGAGGAGGPSVEGGATDVSASAAAVPDSDPCVGAVYGGFRLTGLIASGGQARVYRAMDAGERESAIKVFTGLRGGGHQMRELRAVREVDHPAIVRPEAWSDPGDEPAWIRMPLAPWGSGAGVGGSMQSLAVVRVVLRLLGALAATHARLLIHGDVKAENVLFFSDPLDPDPDARLTDFGVHLSMDELEEQDLRGSWGTPGRSAPEQQGAGLRDAGPWTDLYGVALLARQLVSGAPSGVDTRIADALHRWTDVALDPDPTRRYGSAGQAADALLDSLGDKGLRQHAARMGAGSAVLRRQRMALLAAGHGHRDASPEPFVSGARGQLLCRLLEHAEQCVKQRKPHWVHVRGEEGSGRTALASALAGQFHRAGNPRVLTGTAAPYAANSAALDALHAGFRVDGLLDFEILARLMRWAPSFGIADPSLLRMLAAGFAAVNQGIDACGDAAAGMAEVAVGVLAHMAAAEPLVLIVDDHEDGSRASAEVNLLRRAAEHNGATVLIVTLGTANATGMDSTEDIPPLDEQEAASLASLLLGELDSQDTREALVAWAGGSPGLLRDAAQTWRATRQLDLVPTSDLSRGVAQVLASLPPEDQAAWVACALLRQAGADDRVVREASSRAIPWLAARGRGRVVWRRDVERRAVLDWAQRQPSTGALADALPPPEDLDAQGRFERMLVMGRTDEVPAAAIEWARGALSTGDRWTAIGVLERARTNIPPQAVQAPGDACEMVLQLVNLYRLTGRLQEASQLVAAVPRHLHPARLRGLHSLALAQLAARRGEYSMALELGEDAMAAFVEAGDRRLEGHAAWLLGSSRRRMGEPGEALRLLETAVALLESENDAHALAVAWIGLGHLHFRQGRADEALTAWGRATRLLERGGMWRRLPRSASPWGTCTVRTGIWIRLVTCTRLRRSCSR